MIVLWIVLAVLLGGAAYLTVGTLAGRRALRRSRAEWRARGPWPGRSTVEPDMGGDEAFRWVFLWPVIGISHGWFVLLGWINRPEPKGAKGAGDEA